MSEIQQNHGIRGGFRFCPPSQNNNCLILFVFWTLNDYRSMIVSPSTVKRRNFLIILLTLFVLKDFRSIAGTPSTQRRRKCLIIPKPLRLLVLCHVSEDKARQGCLIFHGTCLPHNKQAKKQQQGPPPLKGNNLDWRQGSIGTRGKHHATEAGRILNQVQSNPPAVRTETISRKDFPVKVYERNVFERSEAYQVLTGTLALQRLLAIHSSEGLSMSRFSSGKQQLFDKHSDLLSGTLTVRSHHEQCMNRHGVFYLHPWHQMSFHSLHGLSSFLEFGKARGECEMHETRAVLLLMKYFKFTCEIRARRYAMASRTTNVSYGSFGNGYYGTAGHSGMDTTGLRNVTVERA